MMMSVMLTMSKRSESYQGQQLDVGSFLTSLPCGCDIKRKDVSGM